ncbi:MAG: Gfo/Idh/MocA family oxidoreductase, partial [Planctomycetota bacterium]
MSRQKPSLSRRHFIRAGAAGTAALLAAPTALARSASETMGVAVVGVNGRGVSHIGGYLGDKRTEIRYIVDIDENVGKKRAEDVAKKQGRRPEVVTDLRKALDANDVDIVSTATPNHWHALCGVWAMQAGKDAYIEKPISHNIHEGRALVAAATKYKRIAQTGTQCRSSPALIDAVKFIEEGGIGECNFARGLCYKRRKSIGALGDYSIPDGVDFDLWSGPATLTDPKLTRKRFHY